jgi:hypothetical protein
MAGSKFNLPSSLRGGGKGADNATNAMSVEEHRTRRAELDASAKMESARLGVVMQSLEVVTKGLDVIKSYQQLQQTKAEWQGRITVAELELKQAGLELAALQEKNAPVKERLEQARHVQQRVLGLFDTLMQEAQDPAISRQEKQHLTTQLLQLTTDLVALAK